MKKIIALLLPVVALSLASCSNLSIDNTGKSDNVIDSKTDESTIVNVGQEYVSVAESNTIAYQMTTGLAALSNNQVLPTASMRHSSYQDLADDEENNEIANDDNETIIDASDEDEGFGVDYPNYDKDHDHEKDEWWNKDHGHWNNPWGHGWGHHENTSEMTDEQVQQVIAILPSVDLLIDEGVSINYVLSESDRADYSIKQTVNIVVSTAEIDTTLVLYYNITRNMTSSITDTELGYEKTESKNGYKGVAVIAEDVEYEFRGTTETSHKAYKDHVEDENEVELTIKTDEYSYIEMEQSEEVKDWLKSSEYSYKVVQNRKTVESYSFESDEEDNEVEIKLTLDGVKYKLSTEVIDSSTYYKVSIKDDTKTKATFVRVATEDENGNVSISYELVESQNR